MRILHVQHSVVETFYSVVIVTMFSGDDLMKRLDLYSLRTGYWNGYNSSVDPTVGNNFATAAFRFAHTLIPVNRPIAFKKRPGLCTTRKLP